MADEPKLEKQKSLARPPSLVAADDRGTVKDSFIGQGQLNIGGNLPVRESSAFESSSAPLVTRETAIELPTVVELDLAAAAGAAPSRGSAGSKSERPRIQWDEEAIAEHDKTRGTRMVIDEPKTPYSIVAHFFVCNIIRFQSDFQCDNAALRKLSPVAFSHFQILWARTRRGSPLRWR